MEESGIDPAVCLDFDLSFVLWWGRFREVSSEQVPGRDTSPKLKRGQRMVPRHATLKDIFAAMYREGQEQAGWSDGWRLVEGEAGRQAVLSTFEQGLDDQL